MTQQECIRDKSLTESEFSRRLAREMRIRPASRGACAWPPEFFSKVDLLPKAFGLGAEAFFLDQPGFAGSRTTSPLAAKL